MNTNLTPDGVCKDCGGTGKRGRLQPNGGYKIVFCDCRKGWALALKSMAPAQDAGEALYDH